MTNNCCSKDVCVCSSKKEIKELKNKLQKEIVEVKRLLAKIEARRKDILKMMTANCEKANLKTHIMYIDDKMLFCENKTVLAAKDHAHNIPF